MRRPDPSRILPVTPSLGTLALVCALFAGTSLAAAETANKPAAASAKTGGSSAAKKSHGRKKPSRARGQQKIDRERARQIQEALVREHYLSGDATGVWNQSSEEAMRRYQAAHGWQTKTVPDSRALIALGLGPKQDHLLNPESAMTSAPVKSAASGPGPADHHKR